MPAGRPTKYNEKLAALVCERVATSPHGLKKLCDTHDDMPDHSTVCLWRFKYKEFSDQYLIAKQKQMNLVMEELDEVLDENTHYYTDENGNRRIDSPSVTLAVAKANNRKWFASKIAPKLYGEAKKEEAKDDDKSVLEKIISGELKIKQND